LRILTLTFSNGEVSVQEAPTPILTSGCVRVRTLHSCISPGTEGNKVRTGRQSLLGKARSRPDQVRQVLDMVRQSGLKGTFQKVRTKLEGAQSLGYSLCGRVVEVAPDVKGFQTGDLVACAGGYANHADEVVVPVNLVARVPDGVPADAASMATLGAIALQGQRLAQPTLGENAVVIGLGVVGLLASQLLKAAGCRVLGADINKPALDLATSSASVDQVLHLGADELDAAVSEFTRGLGADLVLICAATSSSEPVAQAARICRKRGRVVVIGAVGMDLPREDFYMKEISFSVSCSYGPGRYDPEYEEGGSDYPIGYVRWTEQRNLQAVLDMMAARKCDPLALVTHRFAFSEAPKVYAMVAAGQESFSGILLDYPDTEIPRRSLEISCGGKTPSRGEIGVGFIGCGSYAQSFLLPPLRRSSGVCLTSIHTRTGLSAVDVGRRSNFLRAVDSPEAVLEDPQTAAVVVATRHDQHGPIVIAALEAGKHVFVEKPLCLRQDELRGIAEKMESLSSEEGVPILQVGFNRRFSPAAALVRSHLGRSGSPLSMTYRVNAGIIAPEHWIQDPLQGGGRIVGEVCHFVDLMQYFSDANPVEIYAVRVGAQDTSQQPEDNVILTLRFDDGSIGTIIYCSQGGRAMQKEEIQIMGRGRSAVIDNFSSVRLYGRGRKLKRCRGKGQEQEVAAFLAAVQSGKPAIDVNSQIATTLTTLEALESLRLQQPRMIEIGRLGNPTR